MTTIDKWDRFLYLRMMFANGYRNAENIRTIIKNELKSLDDYLKETIEALEVMKKSLRQNNDVENYPEYQKIKPWKENTIEEQRSGIKYYKDGN